MIVRLKNRYQPYISIDICLNFTFIINSAIYFCNNIVSNRKIITMYVQEYREATIEYMFNRSNMFIYRRMCVKYSG